MGLAERDRAEMRNLVMKSLIRRTVVLGEAERLGITITEKELEEGLTRFKEGYPSTTFEQSLLEQMVDADEWKALIRETLLIEKLFLASQPKIPQPTEKDALKYFSENSQLFQREAEARALQIVVSDKKLAEEIRAKVKKAPGQFKDLAKKNSTGPEAAEDAIIVVTKGTLPDALDRALFESKINEISGVIESPYGFHILKVIERSPALNRDFDQVRPQIIATLVEDLKKAWLLRYEEGLIRGANIEYNRKLISRL